MLVMFFVYVLVSLYTWFLMFVALGILHACVSPLQTQTEYTCLPVY